MVAASDSETTTAVLSVLGTFLLWVVSVVFLRFRQYKENTGTIKRRLRENPMGLTHAERDWGYRFDFNNPRDNLDSMPLSLRRAYNAHLNLGENLSIFAAGIALHILLRGTKNGSSEVALLALVHFLMRCLWFVAYMVNRSVMRSMFYGVSFLCMIGIYVLLLESVGIADDGPGGDDDEVGV